jgi:hypothetical protein
MKIKDIIRESIDDFNFINDTPELNGVTFKINSPYDKTIYEIVDVGLRSFVNIVWKMENGESNQTVYKRDYVNKLFRKGEWIPI